MLRVISAWVALPIVLLCCILDTINENYAGAITHLLLLGFIVALSFEIRPHRLISIGLFLLLSGALLYAGSNIGSLLCFLPAAVCVTILIARYLSVRWKAPLLLSCAALTCMTGSQSFWIHQIPYAFDEPRRAVLEHGRWGNALPHDGALTITSQYSYDLLQRLISASKLSSLEQLSHFDELWMVTPTTPFSAEEIQTIEQWVSRGGRLVLITDHTDLFGHASVCNVLLKPFKLEVESDVVLDPMEEGGRYYQPFTTYVGLSANSITGAGESWLIQPGYSERADYGRPSFFSDNQISDEEVAGLFTVGMRKRHGLGGVIMMGDSTLFANFALARPSAQSLLKTILNGAGAVSWYGLAFFVSAAWLFACVLPRRTFRMMASSVCYLAALVCVCAALPSRALDLSGISTVDVSGDSSLVEGHDAPLCTLFSAAYALSECFPVWCDFERGSGTVLIGNDVWRRADFSRPCHSLDVWEGLTSQREPDVNQLLRDCERQSGYSSFWFDTGVGIMRETAYRNFWRRVTVPREEPLHITATSSKWVVASVKISGLPERLVEIRITNLSPSSDWVMIGDGYVGKWITRDTILLRSLWQLPTHSLPDARCRVRDEEIR